MSSTDFRRGQIADRAAKGFSASPPACYRCTGDSTRSGEQDSTHLGALSRVTGLRDWYVQNLSYSGLKHTDWATIYDLTQVCFKTNLPTIWEDALGINDANFGIAVGLMEAAYNDIRVNSRNASGTVFYTIARKTPPSAAVSPNAAWDAFVGSAASGFDLSYIPPGADPNATPPTAYDSGIHPNEYGMQLEAAQLSVLIGTEVSALTPSSSGSSSRFSRFGKRFN